MLSTEIRKDTLKQHWRAFSPTWLFPVLLISAAIYEEVCLNMPGPVLWIVFILFFISGLPVQRLYMRQELTFGEASLYGMIVPFIIWVALVIFKIVVLNIMFGIGRQG